MPRTLIAPPQLEVEYHTGKPRGPTRGLQGFGRKRQHMVCVHRGHQVECHSVSPGEDPRALASALAREGHKVTVRFGSTKIGRAPRKGVGLRGTGYVRRHLRIR